MHLSSPVTATKYWPFDEPVNLITADVDAELALDLLCPWTRISVEALSGPLPRRDSFLRFPGLSASSSLEADTSPTTLSTLLQEILESLCKNRSVPSKPVVAGQVDNKEPSETLNEKI